MANPKPLALILGCCLLCCAWGVHVFIRSTEDGSFSGGRDPETSTRLAEVEVGSGGQNAGRITKRSRPQKEQGQLELLHARLAKVWAIPPETITNPNQDPFEEGYSDPHQEARYNALRSLMKYYAAQEPAAGVEWCVRQPDSELGGDAISELSRTIVFETPEKWPSYLALIPQSEIEPFRLYFLSGIFKLADSRPDDALRCLEASSKFLDHYPPQIKEGLIEYIEEARKRLSR